MPPKTEINLHARRTIGLALQQAVALHRNGRLEQATLLYRQILAAQPAHFDALHLLGVASQQGGNFPAAIELIRRALEIDPGNADAWSNLGNSLRALKRHDEALTCYDRALAIKPDYVEPLYNRGLALQELHRLDEALASYDRALSLRPDYADALYNRAVALQDLKRYQEAITALEHLIGSWPDYPYAFGKLQYARLLCCDWTGLRDNTQRLIDDVAEGKRACDPFSFAAFATDAQVQLQCARVHAGDRFPARPALWQGEQYTHERIRLAYLSADFHNHATAFLMAGLFEKHDRERFELTAISFGPDLQDTMRQRLQPAFDHFIDVRERSDHQVAELLREMEIDIAIDLKGYTQDSRTGIFACRAAPIQVNYLGHPGTMGADYYDYILADATVIPSGQERFYSEKVVRLPDCYQVNDDTRAIASYTPTRAEAGLPDSGFVFCCFNNNYKITPDVFDIWMRLLGKVPGSILWLLESNAVAARNLENEAETRGIPPGRLVFAPRIELDAHLARHRVADLFLDTLPYNAHTTASDALWAGLPVLTCIGDAFPGRVAASLLRAIDLPEMVTHNLGDYEALALELAGKPQRLADIREKLSENRLRMPLFDTDRFRRHIEAVYIAMWERHQRGEPPEGGWSSAPSP